MSWILDTEIHLDANGLGNTIKEKNTISDSAKLIEGSGRANILLPGGTKIHIDDALYSTKSQRNLLSFKDI